MAIQWVLDSTTRILLLLMLARWILISMLQSMVMVVALGTIKHLDSSFHKCMQLRVRFIMYTPVRAPTCGVRMDHPVVSLEMVDGERAAVSQTTLVPHHHGPPHSPPQQLRLHSFPLGQTAYTAVEDHHDRHRHDITQSDGIHLPAGPRAAKDNRVLNNFSGYTQHGVTEG